MFGNGVNMLGKNFEKIFLTRTPRNWGPKLPFFQSEQWLDLASRLLAKSMSKKTRMEKVKCVVLVMACLPMGVLMNPDQVFFVPTMKLAQWGPQSDVFSNVFIFNDRANA